MALYYKENGELRDIDSTVMDQWLATNNPKASDWMLAPVVPEYNSKTQFPPQWQNNNWIIPDKTLEQIEYERNFLSCTPRQARLALLQFNLLNAVETFVANASESIKIEWNHATEIKRNWPPVIEFAKTNNISDEELDSLFELATTL